MGWVGERSHFFCTELPSCRPCLGSFSFHASCPRGLSHVYKGGLQSQNAWVLIQASSSWQTLGNVLEYVLLSPPSRRWGEQQHGLWENSIHLTVFDILRMVPDPWEKVKWGLAVIMLKITKAIVISLLFFPPLKIFFSHVCFAGGKTHSRGGQSHVQSHLGNVSQLDTNTIAL